jgi:hypothetical protein
MGLKEKLTKTIAVVSENLIMGEDILSVLKRDHRKVTELFAEIEDTSDGELRKELFNTLKHGTFNTCSNRRKTVLFQAEKGC